jgi:signal transduction histidine kinase
VTALARLLLWAWLLLAAWPAAATDAVPPPIPGVLELREAELSVRLRGRAEPIISQTQLPLHWDVAYRRQAGWARVRLAFAGDALQAGQPLALYIGRVGNAYRVSLNGVLLAEHGEMRQPNHGWIGKRPLWLRVPGPLLQPHNELVIEIRADILRRAGVSEVRLGPEAALRDAWHASEWRHVTLPRAASIFGLLVAVFCMLLWWQQREALYALAAAWQAAWCLRVTARWWEDAFLAWPEWFRLTQALFWLGCVAGYALVRAVWKGRPRREQWLAAGVLVAWLAAMWLGPDAVLACTVALLAAWAWLLVRLLWETWRAPSGERVWMSTAAVVCWVALVVDIATARLLPARYDEGGLTVWAAVLSGLAVLVIVSLRFQQTRQQLLALTHSLEDRVALRESELAARHEELRRLERVSVKAEERTRILRDMHDGAGAHLITAMRQLEGGVASKGDVLQTLRESLDQLRLSVDALSLPLGDINALLASLRYRLAPRLEAAGIALDWEVDLLPLWPGCTEEAMHHLQYILFEAISNALQHAQATRMGLRAQVQGKGQDQAIVLELRDDGVGIRGGSGNGLRTMRERAALAGVLLELQGGVGGSSVHIRLPMA